MVGLRFGMQCMIIRLSDCVTYCNQNYFTPMFAGMLFYTSIHSILDGICILFARHPLQRSFHHACADDLSLRSAQSIRLPGQTVTENLIATAVTGLDVSISGCIIRNHKRCTFQLDK